MRLILATCFLFLVSCASSEVQQEKTHKSKSQLSAGGEEEFEGSVDREAVRKAIRKHLDEVKKCYEEELKTDPSVAGKIVIEFVINDQGKVKSSRVKSSTINSKKPDHSTASCAADVMKAADFPPAPSKTEITVLYPFEFKKNSRDQ